MFPLSGLPSDDCSALATCSPNAAQRPAGTIVAVLVVDDLVPAAAVRPGGPGLGEACPSGIPSPGCSRRHGATTQRDARDFMPRMNQNQMFWTSR
jgi:hypothetical protein